MDGWLIGLIAVVFLGLVAITYGALADRSKNKRAAAQMLAPPQREIPHFTPTTEAPHYLSDLQAHRPPPDGPPTELTDAERATISAELHLDETVRLAHGYASAHFVTDSRSSWAVLDHPAVLVSRDPVVSIRELLDVLENLVLAKTPLVVAAPELSDEVIRTLEVNHIQRAMRLLAVSGLDADDVERAAATTGATPTTRTDRQSGHLPTQHLGRVARWVSTPTTSYLVPPTAAESTR